MKNLIIGTRASELALWQAEFVRSLLKLKFPELNVELKLIKTTGDKVLEVSLDKIGDKGLFTKEIENELMYGTIDIAVHSLKDLPVELPDGLILAAVTERHDPHDVLIAREKNISIMLLPEKATIATGSVRRKAQLLHLRPDLNIIDLRGNVNTRIQKFLSSDWDGIILAKAGVDRINLSRHISSVLSLAEMLPAVGQGALGIEIPVQNKDLINYIRELNHEPTETSTLAERAFLRELGGGCHNPIAAYCEVNNGRLKLDGLICNTDGSDYRRSFIEEDMNTPESTGKKLARNLLNLSI